jgi:hypothetical protein
MNRKIILVISAAAILIVLILLFSAKKTQDKKSSQSIWSSPLPSATLDAPVTHLVESYVQARDNANGADQATPTNWLAEVKSITTPSWFAELQPPANSQTGSTPADFITSHQKGYKVKAEVKNCIWNYKVAKPTSTSGVVYCQVDDKTIFADSNTDVPSRSLPFGWSGNSSYSVTFQVVKSNGRWLINDDLSEND